MRDRGDSFRIVARIERLPVSAWHTKMRLVVGSSLFFDAFDAISIAFVLPALRPLWHLSPPQAGLLLSIGFGGQVIGSILFGGLAERLGRIPVLTMTILLFAVLSAACAAAWSFQSLLWLRFIQGLALGGETPVAQAYINEFARADQRGRFSLIMQPFFPFGIMIGAFLATLVVPTLGWRWMFIIGASPALILIPMLRLMPESPRWLATRGRFEEADRSLRHIEDMVSENGAKPLPPIPENLPAIVAARTRVSELFKGIYRKRTLALWCLWFCNYFISYAVSTWLPSILTEIFKVPLREALKYNSAFNAVGFLSILFCFVVIDRVGRKGLIAASLGFMAFWFGVLWMVPSPTVAGLVALMSLAYVGNSVVAGALPMYTAENYPNHLRALGGGFGAAWLRIGAFISPNVIGLILPSAGINAVFAVMGLVALIGMIGCILFSEETSGKILEEVSPILR